MTRNPFQRVFDQFQRVAIIGGPRTGKTTLAERVHDRPAYHADSKIGAGAWSDVSALIAKEINEHQGPGVFEGTAVVRALRKGAKVDAVILMTVPKTTQTKGQAAMGRAVVTIFREWRSNNPTVPLYVEPLEAYSPFEDDKADDSAEI